MPLQSFRCNAPLPQHVILPSIFHSPQVHNVDDIALTNEGWARFERINSLFSARNNRERVFQAWLLNVLERWQQNYGNIIAARKICTVLGYILVNIT